MPRGTTVVQTAEETWDGTSGVLNLHDVDENAGFAALPRGIYEAVVDEAVFGESNNSGKPMITLKLKIQAQGEEYHGRVVYNHMVLEGFGLSRLKKACLALCPEEDLTAFDPNNCDQYFVGRRCSVKLSVRKYEGKDQNNVQEIMPPQDGGW